MFDKEYSFKGIHAEKVSMLTAEFDKNKNKLFDRNFDVYMMAPIIGFLYQRKADLSKGKETKIWADILIKNQRDLKFNYSLIMLLDEKNEPVFQERVNKAFRNFGSEKAKNDELLFEQYVRGGVDLLYEKLIENANNSEHFLINLYDFLEEFDERYNQKITQESIDELCRLARN
ncbi:hypothetical protein [Acetobacterium bakii]|uniref:Uncharacterized protein n=1 Tax=Acetobacterium bakii TaxID=52689 RepID=A0A0L6TZN6_9FIRM|nr:hypothetical protein [Acetobacterium bakii]KNZ41729.1 hypothetical protein AKG39_10400 [Acetobacterium bakii]